MQKIILASQSPRRKQLLEWAEVPFEIIVKETDESYPGNLPIDEIAIHIARNKALAIKQSNNITTPILAADTIVVLQDQIIGKPKDRDDAVSILSALSGKQHKVITGVVILHNEKEIAFAETTEVHFHELSLAQIEFYVDNYKPYDKAGAYAIQEWIGVVGIKAVQGDFYNVMGLPVSRVVKAIDNLAIDNG
ncbi:MAG: Maf family nucleotide pyrophosphatase [Ferruginibacter sp.]